jgi:hypothetical protein
LVCPIGIVGKYMADCVSDEAKETRLEKRPVV